MSPSTPTPTPPLVAPILALASWTFVMEIWLYAYRISDVSKYKVPISPLSTKAVLEKHIPRHRHFPAENYAHLHEQPTVFYAVALAVTAMQVSASWAAAAAGGGVYGGVESDGWMTGLAWGYVGARVVHSLVQATTNAPMGRFTAFATSGVMLLAMTLRAGMQLVL